MAEKLVKMMIHKMPDSLRWKLRKISVDRREPMSEIIIRLVRKFVVEETEGRDG